MSTRQLFHERFGLHVELEEARRRFINRLKITVIDQYLSHDYSFLVGSVAFILGESFIMKEQIKQYAKGNYINTLRVVEAIYRTFMGSSSMHYKCDQMHPKIQGVIALSEIDLGITWKDGMFIPTGVELLDKHLIRDPLDWLKTRKYHSVYEPLKKSLKHYLESEKDSTKLYDVITDAYEALEALAKIVTGKDVTLDKNRELFISKLKVSDDYKEILKRYIEYAHNYRHAAKKGEARKPLKKEEVESYIYLTGVFIRLVSSGDGS